MSIYSIFKQLTLASLFAVTAVMAQTPYDEGQQALRDQRWGDAAEQFKKARKTEKQADAAMYWRAHALYKAGRNSEAASQVRELERKYPNSKWIREAGALTIEHQGAVDSTGLDDEMRIYALSRLMEKDPQRALPLVLNTMKNTSSSSVRNDALFVLGMSDDPAAQKAIAEIARESSDPELQADAISILGVAATESSMALLSGLYSESANYQVKEAIIHAHIASDDAAFLVEILKSEKNHDLQREIIHSLGVMDATSELQLIYPTLQNDKTRVAAIEAFSISGDSKMLAQVLANETNPELRKTAIEGIAIADGKDGAQYLKSIYANSSSNEEKMAVLEALIILDDDGGMALEIAKTESDPELQRLAIEVLGIMGASNELGGLYSNLKDKETRKQVLESMAIAGETEGLKQVLETETDTELRVAAIEAFVITDDDSAADFLTKQYAQSSTEEKSAIIEVMMIMDDAEGLIGLLKQESDPELKHEIMQMLTAIDSEAANQYLFKLLEKK